MQKTRIPHTDLEVTRIAYGCMRLPGGWNRNTASPEAMAHARPAFEAALEAGINFFDHADIYCGGGSELCFGELVKEHPGLRDQLVIQTKCGIRFANSLAGTPKRFDFSYEHIVSAVEGSLRRLGVETIDVLLLHRPDALVEPEDVARAFDELEAAGKVRYFGVSNHSGWQIELLKTCVRHPMVANQLQYSLLHTGMLDAGIVVNQKQPTFHEPGEGTLEYCRTHNISIQPWSPLASGLLSPEKATAGEPAHFPALRERVAQMAADKGCSVEALLMAWILRHPAKMVPILGSCHPERIKGACQGTEVSLTREDWYALFQAARGKDIP